MNLKERIRLNQKMYHINKNIKTVEEKEREKAKKDSKKNKVSSFMAVAAGTDSTDVEYKLYYGVGTFKIVGINPTEEELNTIYGTERNNSKPLEYLSVNEENGKRITTLRVTIYLKTDESSDIDQIIPLTFFISNNFRMSKDGNKVMLIDRYGRTAWATQDEYNRRAVPMYSTGPADIDATSYRPCLRNEEQLINFIKAFIGVQNTRIFNKEANTFIANPNMDACICNFDNPDALMKGDISEIKAMLNTKPNNKVKCAIGIRTNNEGKRFFDVFKGLFLPYRSPINKETNTYPKFEKEITKAKESGSYSDTVFSFEPLHEFTVEATNFTKPETVTPTATTKFPWE